MDNIHDPRKSSGLLHQSPISVYTSRRYNTKFYCSISVSILFAFTLLQFHLISHVVDSFPSAASKQDQDSHSHAHQQRTNGGTGGGSRSRTSVAESLMDRIDIDNYLKNHKALKLQIQCLVHDGPCDYVGRWLKPRIRMALLGDCHHCSEKTKGQITKIVDYIQSMYPEEFKAGVAKYLLSVGLEIAEESRLPGVEKESTQSTISFSNSTTTKEDIADVETVTRSVT